MNIRIPCPDLPWKAISPKEAILYIAIILEIQILEGRERFDSREADKYCEVCFWNLFFTLQYGVSHDFAERIRQALLRLPILEALSEVRRIWREHEAG